MGAALLTHPAKRDAVLLGDDEQPVEPELFHQLGGVGHCGCLSVLYVDEDQVWLLGPCQGNRFRGALTGTDDFDPAAHSDDRAGTPKRHGVVIYQQHADPFSRDDLWVRKNTLSRHALSSGGVGRPSIQRCPEWRIREA